MTVQAKATIVGHVIGNITVDPAVLFVIDDHGVPVKDESGAVKHFPTLPKDESLRLLDDYAAAVAEYRG